MSDLRILYTASEIDPFLTTSTVAYVVRMLAQYMQEKEIDIRILVPRFGVIAERKNRLHEVVRLSGMNIAVGHDAKPLIIKVASIPHAKIQVYFIDNEAYFKRKAIFHDKSNTFFKDNDARMLFFCKSVLETVKKLGWEPHIIHCHDWITSLIPMYLKKAYQDDPVLQRTRVIFTLYNNIFSYRFEKALLEKVHVDMDTPIQEAYATDSLADFRDLIQVGIQYADVVTSAEPLQGTPFMGITDQQDIRHIAHNEEGCAIYQELYEQLVAH